MARGGRQQASGRRSLLIWTFYMRRFLARKNRVYEEWRRPESDAISWGELWRWTAKMRRNRAEVSVSLGLAAHKRT